jgi:hypothetical protein
MKTNLLLSSLALVAGSLLAADSGPKDDILGAAKKLGAAANYSWLATTVVPEGSQFRPGPTEGQTEKDGFTHVSMTFGENTTKAVMKGGKAVVTNQDGDWETVSDSDDGEGPARFRSRMIRNFKAPAAQAADLAGAAKELKKDGDAFVGDLTEEGAKAQFRFGNVTGAKGSVKFWVKDGALAKYSVSVKGKVEFNGNERDVDRTTTTEIKDVGTTKVNVPEAAKKKLG